MRKIKLEIVGLSYSQTNTGGYALVLGEIAGKRSLPIIIGALEAQSIAVALEGMTTERPLTHDLFKIFGTNFGISVKEVVIYDLSEGIFYSKMICVRDNNEVIEIESRTSDAVAIALRFKAPIFTNEDILESAGIEMEDNISSYEDDFTTEEKDNIDSNENLTSLNPLEGYSIEELNAMMNEAIEYEDYELASKIRDEISKRK